MSCFVETESNLHFCREQLRSVRFLLLSPQDRIACARFLACGGKGPAPASVLSSRSPFAVDGLDSTFAVSVKASIPQAAPAAAMIQDSTQTGVNLPDDRAGSGDNVSSKKEKQRDKSHDEHVANSEVEVAIDPPKDQNRSGEEPRSGEPKEDGYGGMVEGASDMRAGTVAERAQPASRKFVGTGGGDSGVPESNAASCRGKSKKAKTRGSGQGLLDDNDERNSDGEGGRSLASEVKPESPDSIASEDRSVRGPGIVVASAEPLATAVSTAASDLGDNATPGSGSSQPGSVSPSAGEEDTGTRNEPSAAESHGPGPASGGGGGGGQRRSKGGGSQPGSASPARSQGAAEEAADDGGRRSARRPREAGERDGAPGTKRRLRQTTLLF